MTKQHVSLTTGAYADCDANEKPCPLDGVVHVENVQEAIQLQESILSSAYGSTNSLSKSATGESTSSVFTQKLYSAKENIHIFQTRHKYTLENVSDNYYDPDDELTQQEQAYIDDMSTIGEQVADLAQRHVSPQDEQRYATYVQQEDAARTAHATAVQREEDVYEGRVKGDGQEGRDRHDKQTALKNAIQAREREYENVYGTAYRETLAEAGVTFADGEEEMQRFPQEVPGRTTEQNAIAMSYYPESWTQNLRGFTAQGGKTVGDTSTGISAFVARDNYDIGRAEKLFLSHEAKIDQSQEHGDDSSKTAPKALKHERGMKTPMPEGVDREGNRHGHQYNVVKEGMKSLFFGKDQGFTMGDQERAPRHRNFMLGLIASQGSSNQ